MVFPADRISFASFEGDPFSAYSSQPTSRLMSVTAPQRHEPEEERLPGDLDPSAGPSKSLASVCVPPTEAASSDEAVSTESSNANKLTSSPAPVITTRRWSSVTGREQGLSACHYQSRLPTLSRAHAGGRLSKQGMDAIVCNVRAFLAARRQSDSSGKPATTVINENDIPLSSIQTGLDGPCLQLPALPEGQYLITTDNIAGILDIVVAGVCSMQDNKSPLDCRSLLLPRGTHVKPTPRTQNIIPGISAVADPATTICSPRPCFSLADDLEKFGPLPSTPKTTYSMELISSSFLRDNVKDDATDVDNSGTESQGTSGCLLPHNPRNRHLSWPQSHRVLQRGSFKSNPPRKVLSPFEKRFRQPGQRSTSEPISRRPLKAELNHVTSTTPITCFPRLKSRSCTNDWLTPLGLFDDIENDQSAERREMVADFYNDGVDAHSAVCIYSPLPILEEDSQSNSILPPHAQFEDYQSYVQEYENQWPSQAGEDEENYKKKLGRSIGVASHKRIKVRNSHGQRQDMTENLLNVLRRYSFIPLSDHTPKYIRRDQAAPSSWMKRPQEGDMGRKRSSRELLQEVLHRSSTSSINWLRSKSGSLSPYIAGPQDSKLQEELEGMSCSEDATPHICVDEQRTEQSSI
ncbi:hypothetical protein F5Y12DRAFT_717347 [Xylaria sp. FL1777]|nr:hypothetical protein F5Y12DRAFT_717347 [Xylaria sp. FL1777]